MSIERLNVDYYNSTGSDQIASTTYLSSEPIVEVASDYEAIVEFASIDISNLVLDMAPDYAFLILNDEGDKPGNRFPGYPQYANVVKYSGMLRDVDDLDVWFYDVLNKKPLPASLGQLNVTSDGYFRRQVSQQEYTDYFATGVFKVYVNTSLKLLMPELISPGETMWHEGKEWFMLSSGVGDTTQKLDTLHRLLKATSIRLFSTLPTRHYQVQNQGTGQIIKENILTTIAINDQTTNILNKSSKRYEPNVYRRISLVNEEPIRNFSISVIVYYANGNSMLHTLRPGDYMNLQLAFIPKSSSI